MILKLNFCSYFVASCRILCSAPNFRLHFFGHLFHSPYVEPQYCAKTAWFIDVLAIRDRESQADRRNAETTLPGATKSLPEFVCSFSAD